MTKDELQAERVKIVRQLAQPEEVRSGDKMMRQGDLRKRLTMVDEEIARLDAAAKRTPFVRFYLRDPQ